MLSALSYSLWWATIGAPEPRTSWRRCGRSESKGSSRCPLVTAPPRRRIRFRMIRRGHTGISGTSASSEDARRWNRTAAGSAVCSGKHGPRTGILMMRRSKRPPGPSTIRTSWKYRFTPTAIVGATRPETIGTTRSKPGWRNYRESGSLPRSYTERMTEQRFRRRRRAKYDTLRARTRGRSSAASVTSSNASDPTRWSRRCSRSFDLLRPLDLDKPSRCPHGPGTILAMSGGRSRIDLSILRCSWERGVEDTGRRRGRGTNPNRPVQGRVLRGPGAPAGRLRGEGGHPPGEHRAERRQRAVLRLRDPGRALPELCPPGRDLLGDPGKRERNHREHGLRQWDEGDGRGRARDRGRPRCNHRRGRHGEHDPGAVSHAAGPPRLQPRTRGGPRLDDHGWPLGHLQRLPHGGRRGDHGRAVGAHAGNVRRVRGALSIVFEQGDRVRPVRERDCPGRDPD